MSGRSVIDLGFVCVSGTASELVSVKIIVVRTNSKLSACFSMPAVTV
jgi:hypothetical protein